MWIFFDTATPKRGVQLSHDIESVTCEDKAIKVYFKEDGFQQSFGIISQPSRARKLPILVSFPSKEAANAAFIGMAEQMAKDAGNWFVSPAPEPLERDATRMVTFEGPWSPSMPNETRYPFMGTSGKHFRIEQDGKGNIIFQYEDGTKNICPLDLFPEAAGK